MALEQVHDDEWMVPRVEDSEIEDLHDAGMADLGRQTGLALKTLEQDLDLVVRMPQGGHIQHLHGDFPLNYAVKSLEDDGKSPGAKQAQDLVAVIDDGAGVETDVMMGASGFGHGVLRGGGK